MTRLVLVTTPACSLCDDAKALLSRLRSEFALAVTEVPLDSEDGRALVRRSGALFPPVVVLDGEPFSYGRLSERRLRKALARSARRR